MDEDGETFDSFFKQTEDRLKNQIFFIYNIQASAAQLELCA